MVSDIESESEDNLFINVLNPDPVVDMIVPNPDPVI
jgi:hypothetical protein